MSPMASRRGHHEGSIFQRQSDGLWVASITWKDAAGKVHRPRRYRKTRVQARDALKELEREVERGVQVASKSPALAAYLEQWLTASVEPSVRVKTYQGYQSIVAVRIVPHIGGLKLQQVTPPVIQALYSDLAASGLAPRSVIHTHRCLRRAMQQALKWGMIVRNPCDAVDVPRAPRAEMKVLDRHEVETLLTATRDDRQHALYVVAVTAGLRLGELLGLQWSDIDFDGGRLMVRRALQFQTGKGHVFTEPKTSKSRRTVHLSQRAVTALREHKVRQLEERLMLGSEWKMPELVFTNYTGRPIDPGDMSNRLKAALKVAGLPAIRFHDLRHTAATLLFQAGTHPKLVQELLGHSSIALTMDTYSHVIPAMHGEVAATMDALFGS
ncbi:site-specific integrase [soil metagenome]